jgi:hypothetical protein
MASGSGNQCVTAVARAKVVASFGSKIRTIYGTIYRSFWIGS